MGFAVVRQHVSLRSVVLLLGVAPLARAQQGYDLHVGIETAHLYGNINKYAYYFADLLIGSPVPQRTSVIIDTGSRLVGFPCKGCEHCGRHLEPAFDVSKSSSARWRACSEDCQDTCFRDHCPYTETYSEGSSISGFWFNDFVELGDSVQKNPPVRAEMGCHSRENKLFYTQRANGIMGLAPSQFGASTRPTVLQDLFRDKMHVDTRTFSICLATWGGELTVGGYNASYHVHAGGDGIRWLSMRVSHYYFVFPQGLALGGEAGSQQHIVAVGQEVFGVTIVDSGTTYTYLPEQVFKTLIKHLAEYCDSHAGCGATRANDECFRLADPAAGPSQFPPLRFLFNGRTEILWHADGYLQQRGEPDTWCQTFRQNAMFQTVLGISWIIHKDIIFDISRGQLGVADANCPEHHYSSTELLNEASVVTDGFVGRGAALPSSSSGLLALGGAKGASGGGKTSLVFLVASVLVVSLAASAGFLAFRSFAHQRYATSSAQEGDSDSPAEPALRRTQPQPRGGLLVLAQMVAHPQEAGLPVPIAQQEMGAIA